MSVKRLNKANARQSVKNKPKYDAYRNSAKREKNKMRNLMRHLSRGEVLWDIGEPTYSIVVNRKYDPKGMISWAWDKCVRKTGAGYAQELIAEYRN